MYITKLKQPFSVGTCKLSNTSNEDNPDLISPSPRSSSTLSKATSIPDSNMQLQGIVPRTLSILTAVSLFGLAAAQDSFEPGWQGEGVYTVCNVGTKACLEISEKPRVYPESEHPPLVGKPKSSTGNPKQLWNLEEGWGPVGEDHPVLGIWQKHGDTQLYATATSGRQAT